MQPNIAIICLSSYNLPLLFNITRLSANTLDILDLIAFAVFRLPSLIILDCRQETLAACLLSL